MKSAHEWMSEGVNPKAVVQSSDLWFQMKLGHLSASRMKDAMSKGAARDRLAWKIIAERRTHHYERGYSSPAMEWGVRWECVARGEYEVEKNCFVDTTGFWHHPTIAWVGVSPDGLVGGDGLVEIKCPNSSTHQAYLANKVCPAEYYRQIQCQLWVTGRRWCDFVSYDPRAKDSQLLIVRVDRDDKEIAKMEAGAKVFLNEVNELMTETEQP